MAGRRVRNALKPPSPPPIAPKGRGQTSGTTFAAVTKMFRKRARSPKKSAIAPASKECRAWVRYPCALPGACEPIPARTAAQAEMKWQAQVRDLSVNGLSLKLLRRFEPGTTLFIELPNVADGLSRSIGVRVRNVRPDPVGGWIIGCQFNRPMNEEDLKALLQWVQAGAA